MDSTQQALGEQAADVFTEIQNHICKNLEALDGKATFSSDMWQRSDIQNGDGGGGDTRILTNGVIFEKAGVNFSKVHGVMPADFSARLGHEKKDTPFFATGVSLVIHPRSPLVPTTHANWRFIQLGDKKWFGGGSDLTPYYLFEDDARHFHSVLKQTCDKHNKDYYPRFKKWCDEYFYLPHRKEARGIGGIFFDYIGRDEKVDYDQTYQFVRDLGFAFTDQYIPIVSQRKDLEYTTEQKNFQRIRRGRYVEFNLLYDRGTHFGLHTGGRTESILMSLPPEVTWEYCYEPLPGSEEDLLIKTLQNPRDWL